MGPSEPSPFAELSGSDRLPFLADYVDQTNFTVEKTTPSHTSALFRTSEHAPSVAADSDPENPENVD